jgi:hypothetical protein
VIEQCHLEGKIEMEMRDDCLIIRPFRKKREGWEKAFEKLEPSNFEGSIDNSDQIGNDWDSAEWTW